MVWREPQVHDGDYYFCLTNITSFNAISYLKKVKYPNLPSACSPLRLPLCPYSPSTYEELSSGNNSAKSVSSVSIYSAASGSEPHRITQEDLNDIARDLYLSISSQSSWHPDLSIKT